jgi:DNA-binding transcriptional regulator YdaS (Cro superfamily)
MKKINLTKKQITTIRQAFKDIDREKLAKKIVATKDRNTIDQIATGLFSVSPKRAMAIEQATKGKVTAAMLRPDIFKGNQQ